MANTNSCGALPPFGSVSWLCAQMYHNPPKRGRPTTNLCLEVITADPDDVHRFGRAPTWYIAFQQPADFFKKVRGLGDAELLTFAEAMIAQAEPGCLLGIDAARNLAVYMPTDDGIDVRVLFADGAQGFLLTPAKDAGLASHRHYYDPHGLYRAGKGHILNRRKVSPLAAEVDTLKESMALALRRLDALEVENSRLRAEVADLTAIIVAERQGCAA